MRGTSRDGIYDKEAWCPFYRGTRNKLAICCEGPYRRSALQLTFYSREAFDKHRAQYCNTADCVKCRVYESINRQYEKGE